MKRNLFLLIIFLSCAVTAATQDSYKSNSRLSYYTNEDTVEVMVWVPVSKQDLAVSIDVVFEFDFMFPRADVRAGEINIFYVPRTSFRQGRNELTVSYNENAKWVGSEKVQVYVNNPIENQVKVDRLERKLLKSSVEQNLQYSLIRYTGGIGTENQEYRKYSERKRLRKLNRRVRANKDVPELQCWVISEDPQEQDVTVETLLLAYKLVKELDPYHPIAIVFSTGVGLDTFESVTDIAIVKDRAIHEEDAPYLKITVLPIAD